MKLIFKTLAILIALMFIVCAQQAGAVRLATHFFYWYDAPNNNVDTSKMPYDPPGITSPYNGTYYSSLSTPWYEWQINDMEQAGVDICAVVTWGERHQPDYFKQSVCSRLVDAIRNTGSNIKIACYDDTSSEAASWNADNGRGYVWSDSDDNLKLSCADPNAAWYFYNDKIKPFFEMIPKDLWATHNGLPVANGGRPIIFTYVAYFYKDLWNAHNMWQTVKNEFYNDFGVYPWLCPCWSWFYYNSNMANVADGECIYGAAMGGIHTFTTSNGYTISNLGPGCDTRLIGRTDYRPRWSNYSGTDDGSNDQWLRENFAEVPTDCDVVLLESWNELWEGTSVSRCVDFPARLGGTLSETYYMDKTRENMRALRDRIGAPTSLQNSGFEGGFTSGLASSWEAYWVYGDVTYADETTYKHGGSHAQKIYSSWHQHKAGLYQRVQVTNGTSYTFSAWTWRHDDWNNGSANEETWVGIDPTGGVDPTSSNVIWSSSQYSYHSWTQQSVTATAQSDVITVFLQCRANYGGGDMRAVFDDCSLQVAQTNYVPTFDSCTMSSTSLVADDSTQYTVTLKTSDSNGVNDIKDMRILFNIDTSTYDSSSGRGYLVWGATQSDITRYGGSWDIYSCSGGGYWGFMNNDWGYQYITPVSATTSTSGNQRTVTWTFKVKPAWATAGPASGNYVGMFSTDSVTDTGWQKSDSLFGLTFSVQAAASSEKVSNGNMEGGFFSTGWASTCSNKTSKLPNDWGWNNESGYPFNTFDETTIKHGGSHSLGFAFCQTASSPGKLGIAHQTVNLGSSGATATFTVWAYHTDGNCPSIMCWNPGSGQADPYTANANGRYQWVTTDNWGQRNQWVSRSMTVTADSSGYVTIMVGGAAHGGTASGAKLYIDDVSVQ